MATVTLSLVTVKLEKRDTGFELSDQINIFRTVILVTASVTAKALPIWLSFPIYAVIYIAEAYHFNA